MWGLCHLAVERVRWRKKKGGMGPDYSPPSRMRKRKEKGGRPPSKSGQCLALGQGAPGGEKKEGRRGGVPLNTANGVKKNTKTRIKRYRGGFEEREKCTHFQPVYIKGSDAVVLECRRTYSNQKKKRKTVMIYSP